MQRIALPLMFRAEGARLHWAQMFQDRLGQLEGIIKNLSRLYEEAERLANQRPDEAHLRWACAPQLGVPSQPFTVWSRKATDDRESDYIEAHPTYTDQGLKLHWNFMAAYVQVTCEIVDPTRAVALFVTHGGESLYETVGAVAVMASSGLPVTLEVRTSGANGALLINGINPLVRCQSLDDVINDSAWEPLERVGLPVDASWQDTTYSVENQGFSSAPTDPISAAMDRLRRGGPPIGWFPRTGTGRPAPLWAAPDHHKLIQEIHKMLLPNIKMLFEAGLEPHQQEKQRVTLQVDPPSRGTRKSKLTAAAELPPLALLTLPAASDPFLALATGFGTAYAVEGSRQALDGDLDFLVTADYEAMPTPLGSGGAKVAAYVPMPTSHGILSAPTNIAAERAALIAPEARDDPWRESVRVSWDRIFTTAALGRPSGMAVARFDAPDREPICLLPRRDAGDYRPLALTPAGPQGTPGFARTAFVDAAAEIRLGSGTRSVEYLTAVQDVFGVWSRWEEVPYVGTEPPPSPPRVLSLALSSSYTGSTKCPATLELEISVDWSERTPENVQLAAVFFLMATTASPPPSGTAPDGTIHTDGFPLRLKLPFDGKALTALGGVTVAHLDEFGEKLVEPGPLQGDNGRRYRLHVPVPTLDFAATHYWGVQVWVRSKLVVLPNPTAWSPGDAHPALGKAASPVPVIPLPPPPLPGVPLGSTPDAEGCSHVHLKVSLPAGADVQKIVIWEVAESAMRQMSGLPVRAQEGLIPGLRLKELHEVYDNASFRAQRRSVFRRLLELPGAVRETDITLPKGSTDIHLFAVTTVTSTGVESPWGDTSVKDAHEHLHAFMAPRLRRPSAPEMRATVHLKGKVTFDLLSASNVEVREFRLYRTRSPVAARSTETMGPVFAVVVATRAEAGVTPNSLTGEPIYTASWSGTFEASWDEWLVRAVAVPVDVVPLEAVRGVISAPSDLVTV